MASQHRKLRRLALAGISDSKLVQLLGRLREDPTVLEEQVTRQDIQRSFEDLWQDIKQIEIIGDAAFRWECLSFPKYLAAMVCESAAVRQLMAELWLKRPCTASEPYNLIVYADEVVPGNVLRLDNKRNICCVYAAIKETGPNYLKVRMAVGAHRCDPLLGCKGRCARRYIRMHPHDPAPLISTRQVAGRRRSS